MMSTWKFQLWEIFFRDYENIDERCDNILFTVGALFLFVPAMIITIIGSFNMIWWLAALGILLWIYAIGRFIVGLVHWG